MTWIASGAVQDSAIGRSRGGFKKRDGVGGKRGSEFYSVYSVFWHFEATIEISVVRSGQNASPWSPLFFIIK
jgi:hypothetical protein